MGRLRSVLDTINKQLGRLPLAGKLLIGCLAVIVIMAMLLVAVQSSKTTLVELLPGAAPEDQARAKETLESFDIPYKAVGGKIMVASEKRRQAMALLGQEGKLPQNTQYMFANLLAQNNWMDSRQNIEFKQTQALQNELAAVISNFKGVEKATVMIEAPEPMGLGASVRKPTAAVSVMMRGGRPIEKNMVDAIAGMVSGAKAGLSITSVKVIDAATGRQHTARSEDTFGGDYMEKVAAIEDRIQRKVLDAIAYIGNAQVAVTAQVDVTKRSSVTSTVLPKGQGTGVFETSNSSKTNEEVNSSGAGEPGLGSNTTADVNSGSTSGTRRKSDNTTESKTQVIPGTRKEEVLDPRGMPTRINVMISLPREYVAMLVKQAKAAAGGAGAPAADKDKEAEATQAEIEEKFKQEKARLEGDLEGLVATVAVDTAGARKPEDQQRSVTVSMIPVPMGSIIGGAPTATAGLFSGGGIVGDILGSGMVRTLALGAVVMVAMMMMFMLVRRSTKPVELPSAQEIVGLPPAMETNSDLVGEADEGQQAMMGVELGEDELKYKKMLEQVHEQVKKSPSDAAALLNRWLTTDA